jgi:hypothetical protein
MGAGEIAALGGLSREVDTAIVRLGEHDAIPVTRLPLACD